MFTSISHSSTLHPWSTHIMLCICVLRRDIMTRSIGMAGLTPLIHLATMVGWMWLQAISAPRFLLPLPYSMFLWHFLCRRRYWQGRRTTINPQSLPPHGNVHGLGNIFQYISHIASSHLVASCAESYRARCREFMDINTHCNVTLHRPRTSPRAKRI